MIVGMSLCPSTTIAFLCRATARFHNLSSLAGVGLACGACVCRFADEPAAAPSRENDAPASRAEAARQKIIETRGNLFIVVPTFRLNVPAGERADYKAGRERLSRARPFGRSSRA